MRLGFKWFLRLAMLVGIVALTIVVGAAASARSRIPDLKPWHRLVPSAEVHASEVVGTSAAVGISVAFALAECALAVRTSAARVSAAGPGYRGLRRGQVSAANARLRSTAIPAGPPAARQR